MPIKFDHDELHAALRKDGDLDELAARFKIAPMTVLMHCYKVFGCAPQGWRARAVASAKGKRYTWVKKASLHISSSSPSPAMVRLAEFDPVIMRALRMRRGEAVELPR